MRDSGHSTAPMSKSDVTELVNKRFGHLGEEAIELVTQLALSTRRMRNFLTRLNLDPDRDLQAQLDVLFFYLVRQTDLRTFLMRVRFELAKDMREPTKAALDALEASPPISPLVKSRSDGSTPLPPTRKEATPPVQPVQVSASKSVVTSIPVERNEPTVEAQPRGIPIPRPEPLAGIITLAPQADSTPLAGIIPLDAPSASAEPEPPPPAERPLITDPNYSGPCRRIGKSCRRETPDRRGRVDSIMSNRRYGGDRRKNPFGRRKSDNSK